VGIGAVSGAVVGLVGWAVPAILPAAGSVWGAMGIGALSGSLAGGAGQITANLLNPCVEWHAGLPQAMIVGGVTGGIAGGVGWKARQWWVARAAARGGNTLTGQAYIDDVLSRELSGVRMTHYPRYATREGLKQYGMAVRNQSTIISQYSIDEGRAHVVGTILEEELHHRFWARGIEGSQVHHDLMEPIIERFMLMKGLIK